MTISEKKATHFRLRLAERHGITLSDTAFKRFCESRKTKGAAIQLSCRLGLHKIDFGGNVIAVLWDRKHDVPVTTLPDTATVRGMKQVYRWHNGRIECLKIRRKRK